MPKKQASNTNQPPAAPPTAQHDLPAIIAAMIAGDSLPGTHPPAALADASDYFAAVAMRTDPAAILGLCLLRMEDLYRRSLNTEDLATCRAIVNDQVKLSKMMAEYDFAPPGQADK